MPRPKTVLEWYRVDQARRIWRVLIAGTGLLTFGGLVMAVSFLTHQSEAMRSAAATFGLFCTISGALTTVIGMQRALREDSYLSVRTDGIVFHPGRGEELYFAWAELERIRFDEARQAIVFRRRDGAEHVIDKAFAGSARPELASRLDGLRRKAEWNLLGSA